MITYIFTCRISLEIRKVIFDLDADEQLRQNILFEMHTGRDNYQEFAFDIVSYSKHFNLG